MNSLVVIVCAFDIILLLMLLQRSMRTMLAYTPCRDEQQRLRLQKLLKPVVDAIFLKCTDGNRSDVTDFHAVFNTLLASPPLLTLYFFL